MSCPGCAHDRPAPVRSYLGTHDIFRRMSLERCGDCGLVYADPQPTDAELAAYYEHYWDGEVAVSTPSTRRYYLAQGLSRVRYVARRLDLTRRPSVLDMGAGLGLFHDAMKHAGFAHDYCAVESDRRQLDALRQRFGGHAAFRDLADVPADRAFDLIVLAHVLEHMSRPHDLVGALVARLKPGGVLLIEVPNGDYRYKTNFESHLLFFDPASLRRLVEPHGEVLDVSTVGKLASTLHITQVHPERSLLRPLKEAVKTVIAAATPNFVDTQIARYEMSAYGGDRQWLRALVRKSGDVARS